VPRPAHAPVRLQARLGDAGSASGRQGRAQRGTTIERAIAVQTAGLSRRFGQVQAISGIDLEIPAGVVVGIVGPSGSGKTTLIRMLTGSLSPTGGRVEVLGQRPARFGGRTRQRIGYMPQQFSLYPNLSVRENVDFVASLYGLLLWRRWRRTREVLELLELWPARRRLATDLSGGMQRRLELACALVHQPDLLILDEPTAGIDPILRRTVWDEVHRLRDTGVTVLVTTQYVTEAEECDGVALIEAGRLLSYGTPDELRREALGGEVVEVTMRDVFDAAPLEGRDGVLGIEQIGPRQFRLVVRNAAATTPEAVQAMWRAGAEVVAAREYRPTFEEVFTRLVERARAGQPGAKAPVDATPGETARREAA
jgi:ABC-2 type transport system ATP-binding protein